METIFLAIGPWQLLIILSISLTLLVLPILALIDVLRKEFNGYDKLIWVITILCFNFVGSILYFLIGRRAAITQERTL
ncbi:PLD nuclease N-terminal domain-containing protein [Robertkochia sediminum]|uniref:PLD nuclease N-terminal domain-containing protein n=1 Tax=Robertkochia sediminum TaxID=2785326 RepID=UPI0019335195|nr:PLD nuclease N-terminal domain-containing protein [Robertkochia sediminum]MBL7472567.1 PLDc_N domain-containing protein [Robertkochia sediminum]